MRGSDGQQALAEPERRHAAGLRAVSGNSGLKGWGESTGLLADYFILFASAPAWFSVHISPPRSGQVRLNPEGVRSERQMQETALGCAFRTSSGISLPLPELTTAAHPQWWLSEEEPRAQGERIQG